jgi:cytochrome c-type biogenesis protein CcmH
MKRFLFAMAILAAIGASPARAVLPDEVMSDPAREARARHLSQELRCMVCQNQSIDDSEAPLARDLRLLVRERIASGDSDAQVIDYLVARYGEFVLLRPRFERQTLLLWLVPPLVLFSGGFVLWLQARRRKSRTSEVPPSDMLTSEEQTRLELLMADGTVPTGSTEKGREARG